VFVLISYIQPQLFHAIMFHTIFFWIDAPSKVEELFSFPFLQGRERGQEEKSRGCERVDQGGE
jgi:hypothetical protein